jgi:protein associated with RNAse G/E
MSRITVIKRNLAGEETWRYGGQILKRSKNAIILEALFNRDDMPFMDIFLKHGDLFIELFYVDRWYNIFEIHDRDDNTLKGWYCNVSQPAVFETDERISFVDLALDLWVAPDGKQTVLDEDEFIALSLDNKLKDKALDALEQLKSIFTTSTPFKLIDKIP